MEGVKFACKDVEIDAYGFTFGEGYGKGNFCLTVSTVAGYLTDDFHFVFLPDESDEVGKYLGCIGVLQPKY